MLTVKSRKTVDDLMSLPPETRAELIEGEIFMSPSPGSRHQVMLLNLVESVRDFTRANRLGEVYIAPLDVLLPSGDVVQPDLLFVSSARAGIVSERVNGSPDLVVEVISPGTNVRDRVVKRALYARNGVKEYWLADPEARTIEVLTLRGSAYVLHAVFEAGDELTSPLLAGLRIGVNDVLPG